MRSTRRASRRARDRFGTSWKTNDDRAASKAPSASGKRSATATDRAEPCALALGEPPVGLSIRHRPHLRRGVDADDRDIRPALDRGQPELARARPDVEHVRGTVEPRPDIVEQLGHGGCEDGRPPARVALGDPVVAFALVGHPAIVPRPGWLMRPSAPGDTRRRHTRPPESSRAVTADPRLPAPAAPEDGPLDRSIARRLLAAALGLGLLAEVVLDGSAFGLNMVLLVAATLVAGWLLRRPGRAPDPLDAWLPIAALVLAGFVAVRGDPFLAVLDVLGALAFLGASMAAMSGLPVTRRAASAIAGMAAWTLGAVFLGAPRVAALPGAARSRGPAGRRPGGPLVAAARARPAPRTAAHDLGAVVYLVAVSYCSLHCPGSSGASVATIPITEPEPAVNHQSSSGLSAASAAPIGTPAMVSSWREPKLHCSSTPTR